MIPHLLQLKNFLSYGPEIQTIDFTNYHLICLSGKNGHGKSALLDAITWAIWGQARKISGNSKADQGLLHLGQNHMFVILEFEVNSQLYRVRREYVQTKSKPFSSLDFGIKKDADKIITLTDKTIKDTQEKIENTIGITYESFVNSTFLRQGQSNEFSKKLPKERKEILAQILQLGKFEDKKRIALLQAKKLHSQWTNSCNIKIRIESELQDLMNLKEEKKAIETNIETITTNKKTLEQQLHELQEKKNFFEQSKKEKIVLESEIKKIETEYKFTLHEIEAIASTWHKINNILKQEVNPNQLLLEKEDLEKKLDIVRHKFQEKLKLKETYLNIKEKLQTIAVTFQKDLEQKFYQISLELNSLQEKLKQTIEEKSSILKNLNIFIEENILLQKNAAEVDLIIKKDQNILFKIQELETIFEKNKNQYHLQSIQEKMLTSEIVNIEQKLDDLKTKQNNCPTCAQLLNENEKERISESFKKEQIDLEQKIQEIKKNKKELKELLISQHNQIQSSKNNHENIIHLNTQKTHVEKEQSKLFSKIEELKQESMRLNLLEKTLLNSIATKEKDILFLEKEKNIIINNNPEYKLLYNNLKDIESEIKKLEAQESEQKIIEQNISKIHEKLQNLKNLTLEQSQQDKRKNELFSLFSSAKIYANQLLKYQNALKLNHFHDLSAFNFDQKQIECKKLISEQETELTQLLVQKGSVSQKEKKQIVLQSEKLSLEKTIHSMHQEMTDYYEISKALSKDGIQALLIEQAIPEIEHETNLVLARLTQNQTQIFIESLRDLKKGGNKETLDIKISDSFGLRDYEMFSGGEAFRIDFALRIGISKLLARRAGTTLQTIFIDEGFGSQDEEGLQLIMDNIYKIQNDFAKIIIVSHLPEMKDQFPVQFIIEKKRTGSTVSIALQG